jgi:lipoprotein-anchoring transpeptidase ErfK/SrfK
MVRARSAIWTMAKHPLLTLILIGLALVGEARAQVVFNTPDGPLTVRPHLGRAQPPRAPRPMVAPAAASGQYGGGFIELLMTGRDPGPGLRPAYPTVHGGGHIAAIPGAHGPAAIQRVVDPRFRRQIVAYEGRQGPGSIVIDTPNKFLYLVQEDGTAIRYGIGVGRPGFEWAGLKTVTMKREWPDWHPPAEMLKRRPDLPRFMAGGPANPLGARALYLGSSLYRIHGTNEPWTIGEAVSSGCIRMMNDDVVDLYNRTRVGTRVLVI